MWRGEGLTARGSNNVMNKVRHEGKDRQGGREGPGDVGDVWRGRSSTPVPDDSIEATFDATLRRFRSLSFAPVRRSARAGFHLAPPERPEAVPLALVLGVQEVEQFLTPVGRGRFQALPIGFDPERNEWFDIFPEPLYSSRLRNRAEPVAGRRLGRSNRVATKLHGAVVARGRGSCRDEAADRLRSAGGLARCRMRAGCGPRPRGAARAGEAMHMRWPGRARWPRIRSS